jgi:hypothetical protein
MSGEADAFEIARSIGAEHQIEEVRRQLEQGAAPRVVHDRDGLAAHDVAPYELVVGEPRALFFKAASLKYRKARREGS